MFAKFFGNKNEVSVLNDIRDASDMVSSRTMTNKDKEKVEKKMQRFKEQEDEHRNRIVFGIDKKAGNEMKLIPFERRNEKGLNL